MKKKIFALLALVCMTLTASAEDVPTYSLTKADGAEAHGTITFKVGDNTVTSAAEGDIVTVTFTPADGWVVNDPSGQWYAAIAATPRRTGIDLLKDIEFTAVQGQENTWTFTMARANAEISATYKKLMTNADITVTIGEATYTGSAVEPEVTVKDGENELVKDQDFTVSYSNNTEGGTGIVTITGIGDNYAGETTAEFTINPAQGMVYIYPMDFEKVYGDENFTITPSIVTGDGKIIYMSENESVATVDENTGEVTIVGVGKAVIKIILCATANYTSDSDFYNLTVKPKKVEYEGGDVTQDQNGYTVTLTEDPNGPSAQPLPDDEDLAGLTYSRTLTAPGSSEGDVQIDEKPANLFTICVPFAPETGTAVKYYTLSGVSGESLNFSEVETPVANTPYLVAVTGSVNFTEDCTDQEVTSMEITTTTKDGYTFNGTFTGLTNAQAAGKYILQKGNKWGKVTKEKTNVYIPPFRAFVETPANAAPVLGGAITEGNTTGIENIRTIDQDGTERWYDLSGRRIASPTKGVNILNGKKVVVK